MDIIPTIPINAKEATIGLSSDQNEGVGVSNDGLKRSLFGLPSKGSSSLSLSGVSGASPPTRGTLVLLDDDVSGCDTARASPFRLACAAARAWNQELFSQSV